MMTQEIKNYKAESTAWLKTQQTSIDSCKLNIINASAQIKLLLKTINLEKKEMALKVKSLNHVKKTIANLK